MMLSWFMMGYGSACHEPSDVYSKIGTSFDNKGMNGMIATRIVVHSHFSDGDYDLLKLILRGTVVTKGRFSIRF